MDICGKETGNSGGVGGPTTDFRRFSKIYRLRGRGETPGAVVEEGGIIEAAECHGIRNLGCGKGAGVTGIRQAWRERGGVVGGEHGQKMVGARKGTLVCWDRDS